MVSRWQKFIKNGGNSLNKKYVSLISNFYFLPGSRNGHIMYYKPILLGNLDIKLLKEKKQYMTGYLKELNHSYFITMFKKKKSIWHC